MTPFTLESLLAHPGIGTVDVVADLGGEWARVEVAATVQALISAPRDPDPRRTGPQVRTMAVVVSEPPTTTWRHDATIRRVAEAGYAALVLPRSTLVRDGGQLARRLRVTLLLADDPVVVAKACWELVEGRDALVLNYIRRVVRTIEYTAKNLTDQLGHLSARLGHAVALIDSEGSVAEVGEPLPDTVRAAIRRSRVDLVRRPEGCAASVKVDSATRVGLRLVVHGRDLSEAQLQALAVAAEVAMPAVAARILLDEVEHVTDLAQSTALLADLIDVRGDVDAHLAKRLADRGWRLSGPHVAIHIVGREKVEPVELLRLVLGELGVGQVVHGALHEGGVTCWIAADGAAGMASGTRAQIRQAHRRMMRVAAVATGVGTSAHGAPGLVQSISEARDAARLAKDRPSNNWFVQLEGLGPAQLLAAWTRPETFVEAAHKALALLDVESRRTLAVFLDHESSLTRTAEALGVHRNTIPARIRRIEETLAVDLTDVDSRLALHLACRATR